MVGVEVGVGVRVGAPGVSVAPVGVGGFLMPVGPTVGFPGIGLRVGMGVNVGVGVMGGF